MGIKRLHYFYRSQSRLISFMRVVISQYELNTKPSTGRRLRVRLMHLITSLWTNLGLMLSIIVAMMLTMLYVVANLWLITLETTAMLLMIPLNIFRASQQRTMKH